jgi:hypothetical protein
MASSEEPVNRAYTQEDIQQILNLAIAQHAYEGEFSRAQLPEVAEDLAIPRAIVQQAERTWLQSSDEQLKRDTFNHYRRANLKHALVRFCIVNAGLILLCLLLGWKFLWWLCIIAIVVRAIPLSLKAWTTFYMDGEAYERAFQSWYRRRQVRTVVNHWLNRWLSPT